MSTTFSTPGEMAAEIEQLKTQQAIFTQALKAMAEGRLDGPGSVKGYLLALDPTIQVDPAPFAFGQ